MDHLERSKQVKHPIAKTLLHLMQKKKSNLSVAVDVTDKNQCLELVDQIGSEICLLKTHIDIIENFDDTFITQLTELSQKHSFLIFEDRKFADIGHTVQLQYGQGIYRIANWASITNAHITPGPGIIEGLKYVGLPKGNALLLIAELSSDGHLLDKHHQTIALEWAQKHDDFVIGFIAQHALSDNPAWLTFTPGIHLHSAGDALSQQYRTPCDAIAGGSDILIVGRAIIQANNPLAIAQRYRAEAWEAAVSTSQR